VVDFDAHGRNHAGGGEPPRFRLQLRIAAMLGEAAPSVSAELKDPLSPLTSAGGSILCFGRDYSPDHLARHPKQTTKSVLLASQQASSMSCSLRGQGATKRDRRRLRLAPGSWN
jgi:hypothetical protein